MWNYYLEAKDKVQKQKETAGKQQVSERYSTRAAIHMHIPHMYHSCLHLEQADLSKEF